MTRPRLWIGVHRNLPHTWNPEDGAPWSGLIHAATLARWGDKGGAPPGGWTFASGPSTHAFLAWSEGDRLFRVDADVPVAVKTECHDPLTGFFVPAPADATTACPTVLWELYGPDLDAGIAAARAQEGREYDMSQVLANAAALVVPPFLQGFVPYRGRPGAGDICTESACRGLTALGGPAARLAADVMQDDHFPEELARKLALAEGAPWLGPAHHYADV